LSSVLSVNFHVAQHFADQAPLCSLIYFTLQREKEASGLADVPGGAKGKLLEVEFAFTEDKKLRGQLRDANAIEAQVHAALPSHALVLAWLFCMLQALPD
jgi:hypothetical protein